MKQKYDIEFVTAVWLDFCTQESWTKSKTKVKDLKCDHCKKLHADVEGGICLMSVKGQLNNHICSECGQFYIDLGADDVKKKRKEHADAKKTLVTKIRDLGTYSERYFKNLEDLKIDELEELLVKHTAIKEKADRIDAIEIPEDDQGMEDYLTTDYGVIEQCEWLKSTEQIESYFKEDYHDYFDCGQGYCQEEADVIVKIGKKFYAVTMHAEILSSKQDVGDRLYWVEDIESVEWKEIEKPLPKTRKSSTYIFELSSEEKSLLDSFIKENNITLIKEI
jgi:hypothetical protein